MVHEVWNVFMHVCVSLRFPATSPQTALSCDTAPLTWLSRYLQHSVAGQCSPVKPHVLSQHHGAGPRVHAILRVQHLKHTAVLLRLRAQTLSAPPPPGAVPRGRAARAPRAPLLPPSPPRSGTAAQRAAAPPCPRLAGGQSQEATCGARLRRPIGAFSRGDVTRSAAGPAGRLSVPHAVLAPGPCRPPRRPSQHGGRAASPLRPISAGGRAQRGGRRPSGVPMGARRGRGFGGGGGKGVKFLEGAAGPAAGRGSGAAGPRRRHESQEQEADPRGEAQRPARAEGLAGLDPSQLLRDLSAQPRCLQGAARPGGC